MHIGLSLRPTLSHRQTLSLTPAQRIEVLTHATNLRLELVNVIRGRNYQPEAKCPSCFRELSVGEILKGFKDDPRDFTTKCPDAKCAHRFQPDLKWRDDYGGGELPFYCAMQTLEAMKGLEHLSPDALQKEHGAVYHSALAHFGSVTAAFKKNGVTYTFDEVQDAKEKIRGFLGRLPDAVVAQCANLTVYAVRRMRRALGIPGFSHAQLRDALA